jgi:tRNA pseudouridine55 synthase
MRLGISTDTYDSTGKVTAEKNTDSITQESVRQVILSFKGPQKQVPPMFSAKYHNGKRLYKLAKKGITVERKPVDIDVKEIEILDISNQDIEIRVTCSKGTYIRSLCNDIGQRLGCGAHMNALRRIRSGMFDISQAVRLEDIK